MGVDSHDLHRLHSIFGIYLLKALSCLIRSEELHKAAQKKEGLHSKPSLYNQQNLPEYGLRVPSLGLHITVVFDLRRN